MSKSRHIYRERKPYRFEDYNGKTFGRLTVIGENLERSTNNRHYLICRCECGNIHEARSDGLTAKNNPITECTDSSDSSSYSR